MPRVSGAKALPSLRSWVAGENPDWPGEQTDSVAASTYLLHSLSRSLAHRAKAHQGAMGRDVAVSHDRSAIFPGAVFDQAQKQAAHRKHQPCADTSALPF